MNKYWWAKIQSAFFEEYDYIQEESRENIVSVAKEAETFFKIKRPRYRDVKVTVTVISRSKVFDPWNVHINYLDAFNVRLKKTINQAAGIHGYRQEIEDWKELLRFIIWHEIGHLDYGLDKVAKRKGTDARYYNRLWYRMFPEEQAADKFAFELMKEWKIVLFRELK